MSQNTKKSAFLNCVTECELVRGRNGVAIFDEWRRKEEPEDCSRGEIKRAYRLGEGF
jgi:hypothetical protein